MVGDRAPVTSAPGGGSSDGSDGGSGAGGSGPVSDADGLKTASAGAARSFRVRARSAGMAFVAFLTGFGGATTGEPVAAGASWGSPEAAASPAGPASHFPNELAGRRSVVIGRPARGVSSLGQIGAWTHVYPRRFRLSILTRR